MLGQALCRTVQDGNAAHKLVTSHLRLVAKIAMGYRGYGLPIGEVVSEGNVGLMQAVKKLRSGQRLPPGDLCHVVDPSLDPGIHSALVEPCENGHHGQQKKLFFNLRKVKGEISALEEGDLKPEQVADHRQPLNVSKMRSSR
jgi:RNA polymerase sigma-32 factor